MANPFLKVVNLTIYKRKVTEYLVSKGDVNKVVSEMSQTQEWEKDKYIKVYVDDPIINLYKELTPASCKLVLYVQLNLLYNTDQIELNTEDCMRFLGVESRTTYYKYLQELVDNAILSKCKGSNYWINPLLIFNGNRIEYYREHCPECIQEVNITEIQENRTFKKKKDLMLHFKCKDYYNLKRTIGQEQIDKLLLGTLHLKDVQILNVPKMEYKEIKPFTSLNFKK